MPAPQGDLADKAMAAIDQVVDTVHDRVLRPAIIAARAVAVGFLVAICVVVLAVAAGIALLRLLDVYVFASHQWASWLAIGFCFCAIGVTLWRWRRPASA